MPLKKTASIELPNAMPVRTALVRPEGGLPWEGDEGTIGTATDNAVVLSDDTVSRYHLRVAAERDGVRVVDLGSTNGSFLGDVRIVDCVIPKQAMLRLGRAKLTIGSGLPLTVELHDQNQLGLLRGQAPVMRRLMSQVERAAQSNVSALVFGESGTGKELIARAIHDLGPRAKGPFVTIDCGSVTPSLVASELFGHEKGAFTGATQLRRGAFEEADGGTVFLDEIGELPADLQATLLGALERRRFFRVGGSREISVDVRVVAATNRDLRADVNAGTFRLDLYYRLAVVTLSVPPLRERRDDVPLLIEHFLEQEGVAASLQALLPDPVMERLLAYRWPGNVRELRNFVSATVALGEPATLHGDLGTSRASGIGDLSALPYGAARAKLLEDFERDYVQKLLDRTNGNVAAAAREAEMARSHLNQLLRRHGIR